MADIGSFSFRNDKILHFELDDKLYLQTERIGRAVLLWQEFFLLMKVLWKLPFQVTQNCRPLE